ncbi:MULTISPECIES: hypothetical protein [Streptomyces]|uniref:hypothetical protein n=1 Tax=Streptomyces scabiei TaxID=1930 RepID=UPI0004E6A7A0|nr:MULTISPECIES: hypothetical protein [Streptomyces]MBP5860320.1 hypothetical protein [Streptomyces sp. LBUM 1484]KFG09385.1 hypothetical protein IQ61_08660 [Streptomyces scabiei]MBP5903149.1 hypothetical protein [Streptomyces sp. LBUM 1488]MBP5913392.1 hypothetical protein [Streptomyces sp. LBUM 1486]MDX2830267.1 hypothetical protein [Streptomyces scabiei]
MSTANDDGRPAAGTDDSGRDAGNEDGGRNGRENGRGTPSGDRAEDRAPGPEGEHAPSGSAGSNASAADRRLSTPSTALLGLFLLADVVFVCGALVTLWPVVLATVEPGAEPTATARWSPFGLGDWSLTADTAMLLAVVVCSALGSFVHAATSFATYVGNRRLYASWLWWYLLRAGIGVALALLVYLLLRGGLFAGSSGAGATNPYGFSGIAGLCGLFSKQATDKLREICDTLLSTTGDGDRDRRDGLAAARNGDPGTP